MRTDGGNLIYDAACGAIARSGRRLAGALKSITGVVDHGLFLGLAERALIGTDDGRDVDASDALRRIERRPLASVADAYDYDLFVIGAGSGGVRAARLAAMTGARVARRRGAPGRRHLRDPRLHAEEVHGLRQRVLRSTSRPPRATAGR